MFAKKNSNAKLVSKVNRIAFDDIIEGLDVGSVVYPKYLTADYILQYVRAMQNSIGSNVETLYQILDNKAEALEFSYTRTARFWTPLWRAEYQGQSSRTALTGKEKSPFHGDRTAFSSETQ